MRQLGLVLGFLVCFVLAPLEAYATSCERVTPKEHIEMSDVIFFGQYQKTRKNARRDDETKTVTFRVIKAYKGVESVTIEIAPYGLVNERDFQYRRPTLVFAYYSDHPSVDNTIARIHMCSMLPYQYGEKNHPEYWELLVSMSEEVSAKSADDEK